MNYRRVWEIANGPIPRDEKGRPYEIHHVDGNRANNSLENLKCIPVEEHYRIHKEQKDYQAAWRIANRMGLSKEEIKQLATLGGQSKKGVKKKRVVCPKCGKEGNKDAMTRWHFEKCGIFQPAKPAQSMTCPKCGKTGSARVMRRWHFDNCGKDFSMTEEQKAKYRKPKRKKGNKTLNV